MSTATSTPRFSKKSAPPVCSPCRLCYVSTGLISFVDNVIAGHHATATLAAVTIGTALLWLPMLIPIGTLISLTASVSQLHGAGREREIGPLFRQALWLALGLGLIMFTFLTVVPPLLPAFGIAPDIVPGATAFLHAVRWGGPALTLYFCMRYLSEGMHWTLPTMLLGFGGLLVLAPMGYVLANGKPVSRKWARRPGHRLGGDDVAAGDRVRHLPVVHQALRPPAAVLALRRPRWKAIWDLLRTGLPIGITVLMEGGLFIVTALLIGRLGANEAAAHQIAINVAQLCFMIPMGVAEATTVRVGHAVGRGDGFGVRRAAWAGYAIIMGTQTLSAAVLLFGHDAIVGVYTNDLAVAGLASTCCCTRPPSSSRTASRCCRPARCAAEGHPRADVHRHVRVLGPGHAARRRARPGAGHGPQGMWIGLIVGLTAAAILMGWRLRRSSLRIGQSMLS
jgi:MATE family multidrug resistance protein